jgi:molybdate-binding protein/DNA-binding transcriptional regulator YhcF (GntR family)
MDDAYLYQKIIAEVRQDILEGRLKPGDRLLTVRQMTERWGCTIGTVQRAYQELARQGLVVSRAGQGTHVVKALQHEGESALRRATLVHRSEAFLLDMLTAGYTPAEVDGALHQAMERWQVIAHEPQPEVEARLLRFAGSHDPTLAWLAAHFSEIIPQFRLQLSFSGSLAGLIALAEGKADLAGCHLWDEQSDTYNEPFVRRILPGKRVALLTLAHRRLGLIVPCGNPLGVAGLNDLARPGLRFINRQAGSGTRVWLDVALRKAGISADQILGYAQEAMTHFEVAAAVASAKVDAGFGLESAARSYGLDFIYLVRERYDLVIPEPGVHLEAVQRLSDWLADTAACQVIADFGGYDVEETGKLRWID